MSEQASRPRPAARQRAVAYLRVSTEEQADKGVSLAAQRAKVQQYAELYDLDLVDVIEDAGASAKSLARPGLQRALELLRAGAADALLVMKLDRLTRSVRDLGDLMAGPFAPGAATLLSVGEHLDTSSAAGRLVINILVSVSQWEREAIGERTSTALQHKASLGEYTGGGAPYGYRIAGDRIEPDPAEQAVIKTARALRAAKLSLRKVAAHLDAQGLRARNGKPFHPEKVRRMVGE